MPFAAGPDEAGQPTVVGNSVVRRTARKEGTSATPAQWDAGCLPDISGLKSSDASLRLCGSTRIQDLPALVESCTSSEFMLTAHRTVMCSFDSALRVI